MTTDGSQATYHVSPIGTVEKTDDTVRLHVQDEYADALRGLEGFSHVVVVWWFHENDTPEDRATLLVHPRSRQDLPLTGVFATRSPYRPNLIALDVCRIESIAGTVVTVDGIHAWDGTPILDIKPYIPRIDGSKEGDAARVPDWVRE